jgi:hypothetical protein
MGMYNEVYKRCPDCGKHCEMQIPQVVLGFGCFDLDYPGDRIRELTQDEKRELAYLVNKRYFYCDSCESRFTVKIVVSQEQGGEEVIDMKPKPITVYGGGIVRIAKPGQQLYVREVIGGYGRYRKFKKGDQLVACLKSGHVKNYPISEADITLHDLFEALSAPLPPGVKVEGLPPLEFNYDPTKLMKACECGKDKHGFARHSTWCPKYD